MSKIVGVRSFSELGDENPVEWGTKGGKSDLAFLLNK